MIDFEEAREIVIKNVNELDRIEVRLVEALNYVLAEDIYSSLNLPPFDNSAMDGFACRFEDTKGASESNPIKLKIIDSEPAGKVSQRKVSSGTALKIMTGAPLPEGANSVVPVEFTQEEGDEVKVFKELKEGENIRLAGEDVKSGELVLRKGTKIRPIEIGLLAALGQSKVQVFRKPVVAIITTGDELVGLEEALTPGKIRNSNSYLLWSLILEVGAKPLDLGVVPDEIGKIKEKVRKALQEADIVLTTGGVSVGEYDLVKEAIEEIGAEMKFWKVAQKPAKPLAFFTYQEKFLFGLPGNPGAVFIAFEEYVRPSILKMMGRKDIFRPEIEVVLNEDIKKKPGRLNFARVFVQKKGETFYASLSGHQGSGVLKSFSQANGIALIPKDKSLVKKGEVVKVQLLSQELFSLKEN